MTQSSTSNDRLPSVASKAQQDKLVEDRTEQSHTMPDNDKPAIMHPNFDHSQTLLDPARPLLDIPEPARRNNSQLHRLYGKVVNFYKADNPRLSKWLLLASKSFAEHLDLLSAAQLIDLPDSFYKNSNAQTSAALLTSLEHMTLLDMADIQQAMARYPKLSRYGFLPDDMIKKSKDKHAKSATLRSLTKNYNPDELLTSLYADDWQVILQPELFETGEGSLVTDIMACSVAVHALRQCTSRRSINQSFSATQICQHLRSYLLSQLKLLPAHRLQYRQIRLFAGHIIVAAYHLGWDIQVNADNDVHFNLSSRSALLSRYPNMQDYAINGWSL